MCSMWEKRGERGPERMKLKTNIGQLQRRVPVVCEAEKQFVASDRLLERWQLNSFTQMMPATWRSVLSKSAGEESQALHSSPPATSLTQGITSLSFLLPASELSPSVRISLSSRGGGNKAEVHLPVPPAKPRGPRWTTTDPWGMS